MGVLSALGGMLRQVYQAIAGPGIDAVVEEVKRSLEGDVIDAFATSTSPAGLPWPPITHRVGKPLIDTGNLLRRSLAATRTPVRIGNTLVFSLDDPPYAAVHQFGWGVNRREFFGLSRASVSRLGRKAAQVIVQLVINGVKV